MGGRGSGRRSSYCGKPETNDSMPLDIRKLARSGALVPGHSFGWQWLVNNRQVAGISIRVDWQSMVLAYRVRSTGELVEQRVHTQTSPCHLGGGRRAPRGRHATGGGDRWPSRSGAGPGPRCRMWAS